MPTWNASSSRGRAAGAPGSCGRRTRRAGARRTAWAGTRRSRRSRCARRPRRGWCASRSSTGACAGRRARRARPRGRRCPACRRRGSPHRRTRASPRRARRGRWRPPRRCSPPPPAKRSGSRGSPTNRRLREPCRDSAMAMTSANVSGEIAFRTARSGRFSARRRRCSKNWRQRGNRSGARRRHRRRADLNRVMHKVINGDAPEIFFATGRPRARSATAPTTRPRRISRPRCRSRPRQGPSARVSPPTTRSRRRRAPAARPGRRAW